MPTILSDDDKQTVKRTVPKGSNKIHAVAVAKLYIAYPNRHKWTYTGLQGAAVLANDLVGNTFWIKLVDISPLNRGVIWDQEIYDTFSYNQDRTFFHTFELEQCLAGLSFADEKEAKQFKKKIDEREKNAHKNTRNKPFGMAAGTSNGATTNGGGHSHGLLGSITGSLFGHKHSSHQQQENHSIIPPKNLASPASSSPNQSGRSSAIDTADPSMQPVLQELLQMGITEDQIEENADFIRMQHFNIPAWTTSGTTASSQKGRCTPASTDITCQGPITTTTKIQSAATACRCWKIREPGSSSTGKSAGFLEYCASRPPTAAEKDRGRLGAQVWRPASFRWTARCIQSSPTPSARSWPCSSATACTRRHSGWAAASPACTGCAYSGCSPSTASTQDPSSSTIARCRSSAPASTSSFVWAPRSSSTSSVRLTPRSCSAGKPRTTSATSTGWRCSSAATTSFKPVPRGCASTAAASTTRSKRRSSPTTSSSASSTSIRGGAKLKKVSDTEKNDRSGASVPGSSTAPPPSSSGGGGGADGGLAGALASALAARKSKVSHSDDEDDDDW
ncbi:Actin associated WSP1 protein [Lasiodiplodia theobromae]|uniref:Actin associated WSP1 protein n=1 Tax=Lasiodiplodia theobromae TaxID=45133 RepID=UPI0015C33A51|nr:Actin associated WSP1 protein [Lasiodiplodia theobromae]KAF4537625.1 Actin associated WSP1 protein [Lasiodiplodia theobromae]